MFFNNFISKKLSFYRTKHIFQHYKDFKSIEELKELINFTVKNKKNYIILGNGSNVFFANNFIKTVILKNEIPETIIEKGNGLIEVSSSVKTMNLLKYCYKRNYDCFYFLSSVPSTIGGNVAMNAGNGKLSNQFISNYIVSLKVFDGKKIFSLKKNEINFKYRESKFSGNNNLFIISALFRFKNKKIKINPIKERLKWAKKYQDYSAPNCGSVFKDRYSFIMFLLGGIKIFGTEFSPKTQNWILNKSENTKGIKTLIFLCRIFHIIFFKIAKLEIIKIK